jgi:hypothetical protein
LQLRATCLSAVVLIAAVFAALSSDIEGADAEPPPRVGEISVYVFTPNDPERHALELHVFPERGVAVLKTLMSDERGINYAIAIPKRPFEGSLDLNFPRLGKIVGKVFVAPGQEACGENGEQWSARKAYAALRDTCQAIEPLRCDDGGPAA